MAKAKVKFDMKQVNKYRFWIGLGVLVLLLMGMGFIQMTSAAGDKEKKAYHDKMKAVKGLSDFKNEKFLPAWNDREEKLRKQRDDIWAKAWEPQRSIQTWFEKPFWEKKIDAKTGNLVWSQFEPNVPAKLTRDNTGDWAWKFPVEPIDGTSLDIFKDTLYITQFHGFEKELVDAKFPVEFQGGFDVLMAPVWWKRGATPSNEEVWLAQEEFWIKRELVRDILGALNSLAQMIPDPIGKDEKTPGEVKVRKRFYNNLWELDLMFESQDRDRFLSPRSRINNVHVDHRIMPLDNPVTGSKTEFVLKQGAAVFPLRVQGEPLGYGQSREFIKTRGTLPTTFDPAKDFTVEQVFTQKNSPIKMIQDLKINFFGHRLANKAPVTRSPNVLKMEKAGDAAGGEGGGESGPGGPGGPMMGGGPDGMPRGPGMGMMGGSGSARNPTLINNIERDRYLHATDQCRHLPFAISLVLDQSVMNEVIAALVNSRLRVQVTQFHYQHLNGFRGGNFLAGSASGTVDGGPGGPGGPGGSPAGPGGPGGFRPLGGKPGGFGSAGEGSGSPDGGMRPGGFGPGPGGPGGFRPPSPGGPGGGMATDSSSTEVNLVEFSIYGVASLFERPGAPPVVESKDDEKK